jgi:hypothetical protein
MAREFNGKGACMRCAIQADKLLADSGLVTRGGVVMFPNPPIKLLNRTPQ